MELRKIWLRALIAFTFFFITGCVAEDKDSRDTVDDTDPDDSVDAVQMECDYLANAQWQVNPNVIRLSGNVELIDSTPNSNFGYSLCSGFGFTCVGNYNAQGGLGTVSCWNGTPSTDTVPTITFVGQVPDGLLGIKCEIALSPAQDNGGGRPEGIPHLFTSSQYATNPSGDTNAGRMYVLPLDPTRGAEQNVENEAIYIFNGVGNDAYADVEYVPQDVLGGYSSEFCFGNTNTDPAVGGIYCMRADDFWAMPMGELSIVDLFSYGANFFGHGDIDTLQQGESEWYPFYSLPLSGGRRAVGDPKYDVGIPNAGLVHVMEADGFSMLAMTGATANAQFGHTMAEIHNGTTGHAILGSSVAQDALMVGDLDFVDPVDAVIGFVLGPQHRLAHDADAETYGNTYWGQKIATFEVCGQTYVVIAAPSAGRELESESVGAIYIYTEEQIIEAAGIYQADFSDINSSPIPIVAVFGPQDGSFGESVEIIPGALPLQTQFVVGNTDRGATHWFTLGSLIEP